MRHLRSGLPAQDRVVLTELAGALRVIDYDEAAEAIDEYLRSGGSGWRSSAEFLSHLRQDVWKDFDNVGEEDERPLYERYERTISQAQSALVRRHNPTQNPTQNPSCARPTRFVVKRERTGAKLPSMNVTCPEDVIPAARTLIGDRAYEVFLVLYLNNMNCLMGYEELTEDSVAGVAVNGGNLIRNALIAGAVGLITVHQHPSGSLRPSEDDYTLWGVLGRQARTMGIHLLDNMIVTDDGYYSEAQER